MPLYPNFDATKGSLHVHLMGPPGVGKSVIAHLVTAKLKLAGVPTEMVQEYAKELLWAGRLDPDHQILTTAEQIRREQHLEGRVRVIVTDSPPILGMLYAKPEMREPLRMMISSLTAHWSTVDYLLSRPDMAASYEQIGRNETAEESARLGRLLERLTAGIGPAHLVMREHIDGAGWISDAVVTDVLSLINGPRHSHSDHESPSPGP